MALDETKLYEESCNGFRHYSTAVMTIRTITIAQGFAVLTAVSYLSTSNQFLLSLFATVFGVLLTGVLAALQWNYYLHASTLLDFLVALESRLSPLEGSTGPWTTYAAPRSRRFRSWWGRLVYLHGPYVLLLLALVSLLAYNVAKLAQTITETCGGESVLGE